MSLIDRAATFRGNAVDHGVSLTKNKFPQWVAQLVATEIYDEDEKVWVDFLKYDEREIIAYLVLFGSKGETLNCQQLKKAVGWDGNSFQALNEMDLTKTVVQFRVEEHTFENNISLQVNWIDAADAEPGRSVRKLEANELKDLDAQYANLLKQAGKKAAPVKASKKPAAPKKPTAVKAKGIKPTQAKAPVKKTTKKSNDPLGPPTVDDASPPMPMPNPNMPVGHCTKDEAWDTVVGLKDDKTITDEILGKTWIAAATEVVGPGRFKNYPEGFTDEEWFQIKEKTLAVVAKF